MTDGHDCMSFSKQQRQVCLLQGSLIHSSGCSWQQSGQARSLCRGGLTETGVSWLPISLHRFEQSIADWMRNARYLRLLFLAYCNWICISPAQSFVWQEIHQWRDVRLSRTKPHGKHANANGSQSSLLAMSSPTSPVGPFDLRFSSNAGGEPQLQISAIRTTHQ